MKTAPLDTMNEKAEFYDPEHLTRWTMPSNYFGEVWPNYYSAGVGRSRDSEALEESNFRSVQRALEKLPPFDDEYSRQSIREGHWAVGWVEWIAIHQDDAEALKLCDGIKAKLEDYPVVDEEDFSNPEHEQAGQVWRDCYNAKERVEYVRKYRSQFEFHDFPDLLGCLRGKYFSGYASELIAR